MAIAMAASLQDLTCITPPLSSSSRRISLQSTRLFCKTPLKHECRFALQNIELETAEPSEIRGVDDGLLEKTKNKKERKRKPSFFDETKERWSVRIASQRPKLPWEEEKEQNPVSTYNFSALSLGEEEEEVGFFPKKPTEFQRPSQRFPVRSRPFAAPWANGHSSRSASHGKTPFNYSAGFGGKKNKEPSNTEIPKNTVGEVLEKLKKMEFDNEVVNAFSSINEVIEGKTQSPDSKFNNVVIRGKEISGYVDNELGKRDKSYSPHSRVKESLKHGEFGSRGKSHSLQSGVKQSLKNGELLQRGKSHSLHFGRKQSVKIGELAQRGKSHSLHFGGKQSVKNGELAQRGKSHTLHFGGKQSVKNGEFEQRDKKEGVRTGESNFTDKSYSLPFGVQDTDNNGEFGLTNKSHSLPSGVKDSDKTDDSGLRVKSYRLPFQFKEGGDPIEFPWVARAEERGNVEQRRSRSTTALAESTIPEPELLRLRSLALHMKERINIGVAGVTQAIVAAIHDKWRHVEVVKIKFEGPPAMNMKRTHEILERKTGGLVILRCGSFVVLYRGMGYELPCVQSYRQHLHIIHDTLPHDMIPATDNIGDTKVNALVRATVSSGTSSPTNYDKCESPHETDIEIILESLGPRFRDWSGCAPLPVDADLLPPVLPGYKPPFRFLPHGMRHCLKNKDMTALRRLARQMPPHFALGRNRVLQGLAAAMVNLWETSVIAKIAIKRGVQNTCNERMAEELEKLTGGILVSRNKEYIVFYRGNDFLSPSVKEVLVNREKLAKSLLDEEEKARMKAHASTLSNTSTARGPLVAGTLEETLEAKSRWGMQPSTHERDEMKRDMTLSRHAALIKHLEKKLALAKRKVSKAERALLKVQEDLKPAELPTDLEIITDEERITFRKMGLSMKPYLLLGRRGVFDGTVENMHLHWKYRELIKILVKGKRFLQVKHIAISLEAESGGVLISVDKTTKGYAIILYRGKNYQRPSMVRPGNLLTKRKALARSVELQRREALNHHILDLQMQIEKLRSEFDQMRTVWEKEGQEDSYVTSEDEILSEDDEDSEDEV
ncbi:hypothetical protein AMTRI_Chr02g223980 [Amborella trichopoda]|uniref:CRM domain-containing protein n=1 Tax=Amborella trichopoda TaxID=13333 RepID=W1P371_AMBTC|nr:CRM-domain containing factor CFM3, chloroplastic/mitochondrial [Amborella trichopoda]ERN02031.1 hypothetical protein AMTR_s00045p00114550 [Amborella trichopoda]|eukprot:XP_006840356.1 CRM-domain containing factor CFM3, chloroplastic/mitochondrial [Amborella trichopoda]